MQIDDLINWTKLSEYLANNQTSIRKGKYPKKYEQKIDKLYQLLEIFDKDKEIFTREQVQNWLNNLNFAE